MVFDGFPEEIFYTDGSFKNELVCSRDHLWLLCESMQHRTSTSGWLDVHNADYSRYVMLLPLGEGRCVIEINVPGTHILQRILRDRYAEVNDITSERFGNAELLNANEIFHYTDGFAICYQWLKWHEIFEGFITSPVDDRDISMPLT